MRESGVLGQSGRLLELFDFLALRSADGRPPKEAEIALAVFGKSDADAMRDDPVARVYIHRLRKRLDEFYLRNGTPAGVRLDIPKGDYRIVWHQPERRRRSRGGDAGCRGDGRAPLPSRKMSWGLIAACVAVLAIGGNIVAWSMLAGRPAAKRRAPGRHRDLERDRGQQAAAADRGRRLLHVRRVRGSRGAEAPDPRLRDQQQGRPGLSPARQSGKHRDVFGRGHAIPARVGGVCAG